MRVLIYTYGSRGDVQPYLGLARGLNAAGHDPVLVGPASYAGFAAEYGVTYHPLFEGPLQLMAEQGTTRPSPKEALRLLKTVREMMPKLLAGCSDAAADGADLVVFHPGTYVGQHIGEWLGVPAVPAALQHGYVPTREYPNPSLSAEWLPGFLNKLSYQLLKTAGSTYKKPVEQWRADVLHLAPHRFVQDPFRAPDGSPAPVLHAFSPHVFRGATDWPEYVHTTGYWFLPATPGWQPSAALAQFLADGAAPVYVGFGSQVGRDPAHTTAVVIEALRRTGQRAILATGGGGLVAPDQSELSAAHFVLDQAPHDWLFPKVAAVAHAGGAGATAAAIAAGRPQVISPSHNEALYWGRRVERLGVGTAPIPQRALTADNLAAALTGAATSPDFAAAAAELGGKVRTEDGVANAIALLERIHRQTPAMA